MKSIFEHASEEKLEESRSMTKVAAILVVGALLALVIGWWQASLVIAIVAVFFALRVLGCRRWIKRYAEMAKATWAVDEGEVFQMSADVGGGEYLTVSGDTQEADERAMVRRVAEKVEADPVAFRESLRLMLEDGATRFPDWADYIREAKVEALEVETTGDDGEMTVLFAGDAKWFFNARYDADGFKEFYVKTE